MINERLLEQWRRNRGKTDANYKVFFESILEELFEPLYSKELIKEAVAEIMKRHENSFDNLDANKIIDTTNDIQVFSINETEMMGYDNTKTMLETIKEISSRKQDTEQKAKWKDIGASGKWQKDKNQEEETLYTADYESCKFR